MKIQQEDNVKKAVIKYILLLLLQRFIGIGLFFASAGTFYDSTYGAGKREQTQ
jgi:hypothetical protein